MKKSGEWEIIESSDVKRTKAALLQAERTQRLEQARCLIEASLDPLVTIGPDGKITDANHATELATGLPRTELVDTDFCDYFTRPEEAREGYKRVFSEGMVRNYPLAIRHVDGSVIDVLYNASVYKDEAGKVVGVFAAARDVTEQKRSTDELRRTESELREAQRIAHVGNWELDTATGEVRWSDELKRIFGRDTKSDPPTYDGLREVLTPDSYERMDAAIQRAIQTGEPYEIELELRIPEGAPRWISARGELSTDGHGEAVGLRGTALDVTQMRKAERDARAALLYSRSLIEASLDPLVTISAEGKITDVNHATESATGRSRDQLMGTDFADYFTEPDKARAGYQHVFAEGFVRDYPLAIHNVSGSVMDVLYNATLYHGETGDVQGVFAAARDVTQRKRAEDELRRLNEELERRVQARTTQLEDAVRELQAFNYSVSHDLRAPLRSLDGFSTAVLEDYADKLDDEGREDLGRIRAAARKMGELIDGLLGLSRLSRADLQLVDLDLSGIAEEIAGDLRASEPSRDVTFDIEPGLHAVADQSLLRSLLQNLLDNAWKYTSHNDAAHIEFGAEDIDGERAYFVRDDGAGFDMAYVDKLFVAFQRLHPEREFAGIGIGLVTVARIVHRHEGRVWAEGDIGQGATFHFTLNAAPPGEVE